MDGAEPLVRYEGDEWRVMRAGRLVFRTRSHKDAKAWIAAHYLPLTSVRSQPPAAAQAAPKPQMRFRPG